MSKRQHEGLAGWLGGGPWKVLEDCPASRHNTLSAGRGKFCLRGGRSASGRPKCVCPRAAALVKAENIQRRENEKARGVNRNGIRVPSWQSNTLAQGMPDLEAGKCRSPKGRRIIDDAEGGQPDSQRVLAARFLCADCPVFEKCKAWVTRDEKPAGSWGLMYAGMTPRERVRASRGGRGA